MKKYRLVCGPHTGLALSPFYPLWAAMVNDPEFEVVQQLDVREEDLQDIDVLVLFEPRFLSYTTNAKLKVGIFADLHRSNEAAFEDLKRRVDWCDIPFSPYKFSRVSLSSVPFFLPPEYLDRFVVLPHSVASSSVWRYPDISTRWIYRDIDVFVLKPLSPSSYPFIEDVLRTKFMDGCIYVYDHPSYSYTPLSRDARYEWFSRLERAKISLAGMGFGHTGYPVGKYIEYRLAGTVMLAERPPEIYRRVLGLRDTRDCFLFDRGEFKRMRQVIDWLYRNPDEAQKISDLARETAACHSGDRQVAYIKHICSEFMKTGLLPQGDDQVEIYRQITGLDKFDLL